MPHALNDAAQANRALPVCVLLATALHLVALGAIELPGEPPPRPPEALRILLAPPVSAPLASVLAAPEPAIPPTTANQPRTERPPPPAPHSAPQQDQTPLKPAAPPRLLEGRTLHDLARAVAARTADHQVPRPDPRTVRLTDAPTRPDFAFYLAAWRREVERVGRLNYPDAARKRKLTGSLRLLVVINADGALADVRLLESSGHAVLDDAALRIVRLAAPFAPFPPRIHALADTLEIERVWRFRGEAGSLL